MIYGLQNYLTNPLYSSFLSILLIIGTHKVGLIVLNLEIFKRKIPFSNFSNINFQASCIGILVINLFIFPFLLFGNQASLLLKLISILLILCGILEILNFINSYQLIKKKIFKFKREFEDITFYILLIFLFFYFLLSLSPITSADALDYHVGVALNILNYNKIIIPTYWFTGMQFGFGESMIALGLSIGAEQFSNLIQFSGLISITGIFLCISKKKFFFNSKYFLTCIILSCPILVFLISSSKPQLYFASLVFLSTCIVFFNLTNKKSLYFKENFIFLTLLLFVAVMGKFSFNLSALLVWLTAYYFMLKKKYFFFPFFSSIALFSITVFLLIIWKFNNFGGNIINYFFNPFPIHLPSYENFFQHIKGAPEFTYPSFLFFPLSFRRLTEFIGMPILLICFILFKPNEKKIILISLIVIWHILANLFGSPSPRYFLETILWAGLGISFSTNIINIKFLKNIFLLQIAVIFIILIYGVTNLFPGSINNNLKENVMKKNANGYSLFRWIDDNLPSDSKVMINYRTVSLSKNYIIPLGFINFTNKKDYYYYLNQIKKLKPEYYVEINSKIKNNNKCILETFAHNDQVMFESRNPFNRDKNFSSATIYKIDHNNLYNCFYDN